MASTPMARIAALKNALAQHPEDAGSWFELGSLLHQVGGFANAAAALQRASSLAPRHAPAWLALGRSQLALGAVDDALEAFERALALVPDDASIGLSLADALLFLGRADDAAARFRAVLALHPACGAAWWGLANIKTLRLSPDEGRWLEQRYRDTATDGIDRIAMGFALGKVFEDDVRYADAYAVLQSANAGMRRRLPWDRDGFLARLQHMFAVFADASTQAQRASLGADVIFVVSLPRAGSTLAEQILAAHPLVEGASELGDLGAVIQEESLRRRLSFPDWIPAATPQDWSRMGLRYLERTARWRERRPRFTDKMPNNWLYLGAALAMLPGAHVVDCRRDALETAWSCFKQLFSGGAVFSYDFESIAVYSHAYERAMALWPQRFPGSVFRHDYETLLATPEVAIRALLDACALPFDPACLRFHETARSVRTASAAQVRVPLRADSARAARYGALLDPLRDALAAC